MYKRIYIDEPHKRLVIALIYIVVGLIILLVATSWYYESEISERDKVIINLQNKYDNVLRAYSDLNVSVSTLRDIVSSFVLLERSFPRVLSEEEINATASILEKIDIDEDDLIKSIIEIYSWVRENIKYADDAYVPYIVDVKTVSIDDKIYIRSFGVLHGKNYVQSPSLTIELKQGDCEDHAILVYAMIKYYMRYIHGKEYPLYISLLSFKNIGDHVIVLLQVEKDKTLIIDVTSDYITDVLTNTKSAIEVLFEYSNIRGEIDYLRLYEIDVTTGQYRLVVDGDISKIASFLDSQY